MWFGSRYIEKDEPVLYFENITMSLLTEQSSPIMARGGWSNLPRVIWEDRSEVQFSVSEGVMSSISMGILLSANVTESSQAEPILVPMREGPFSFEISDDNGPPSIMIQHDLVQMPKKKTFIFEYARDVAQKKIYGKQDKDNPKKIYLYQDKECTIPASKDTKYIIDYYYEYGDKALIYTIQKERFNGLFTLEGKFYSKDENEGLDYTNLMYMPKVRVVSDISLRLGERANPTMSVFNIIGLPENTGGNKNGLILEITRLSDDINADI